MEATIKNKVWKIVVETFSGRAEALKSEWFEHTDNTDYMDLHRFY